MSLYPTTLFHFTDKKSLYGILKGDFSISYAREKIIARNETREFAVPMVSFCDLRLTELKTFVGSHGHPGKYGNFGIGLTKDWANRQGLNPVWYVNRHSTVMERLMAAAGEVFNHINRITDPVQDAAMRLAYMNVLNTYRYIKNYEGELWRQGALTDPNYRFADEREWRHVPEMDNRFPSFLPVKKNFNKAKSNRLVAHLRLTFKPKDIKYLIVERDADIIPMIEHLRGVKERFGPREIARLTSRIMTADQIHDDV